MLRQTLILFILAVSFFFSLCKFFLLISIGYSTFILGYKSKAGLKLKFSFFPAHSPASYRVCVVSLYFSAFCSSSSCNSRGFYVVNGVYTWNWLCLSSLNVWILFVSHFIFFFSEWKERNIQKKSISTLTAASHMNIKRERRLGSLFSIIIIKKGFLSFLPFLSCWMSLLASLSSFSLP